MLTHVSHWRAALLTLLLVCAVRGFGAPAPPGPLLIVRLGEKPIALAGPWQFHPGDDMKWADPQFSDSDWGWLSANRTWARQGYFKYTGYAWYRLHLQFQQEGVEFPNVALLMTRVDDAYELYWNGVLGGAQRKVSAQSYLARVRAATTDHRAGSGS